jgi:hypothetical protein
MQNEIGRKDLGELCDLLVDRTMQLLKVLEKKTDPVRIQELKKEVELIQSAIKAKQATADGKSHDHV